MSRRHPRRSNESGFALLLVFAMAAAVMVMLYLEMPRVAFEYQRNKEGMLVERGEQFTRAISLYYRKFAKLPQNIDELESSNNLRFLRKKYEDPMTGKDEWRLVHVDAAGQYTDSLVHKRQGQEEKKGPSALAATIQGIGSQAEYTPGLGGDQEKNPALQRRASDRISPGAPGSGSSGAAGESGDTEQPSEGRSGPGSGDAPPEGTPPAPGAETPANPTNQAGQQQTGTPGTPGAPGTQTGTNPSVVPGAPGNFAPGRTGAGNSQNSQPGSGTGSSSGGGFGFGSGSGFGNSTSTGNQSQPATTPGGTTPGGANQSGPFGSSSPFGQQNQQQRPAPIQDQTMRAIGNVITGQQQRPGSGMGGATGTGGLGGSLPGAGGTGGLVGVASKADFTGILVYNEKTNVKEWEFLFDMKKAAQAANSQQGNQQGNSQQQQGNQQNSRPTMNNPFQSAPMGGGNRR